MAFVVGAVVASVASFPAKQEDTTPTPYQPMQWNGGYQTHSLGGGMIQIDVKGNAYTTSGAALGYAYRRANEMCPDGFVVVDGTNGSHEEISSESERWGRYSSTTTTVDTKPRVSLIVRCKAPPEFRPELKSQTDLPTDLEKRE